MTMLSQDTGRKLVALLAKPPRVKHGCCVDKACTDATCMELPEGKTCGHCVHEYRCCLMFGHTPTDTYCDWFPRRFRQRAGGTTL